jgi:hypothetical protein
MEKLNDSDFSIIVLPDSQIYLKSRPDIFKKQLEWVAENVDTLNIKFVLNVGDLVDTGNSLSQWNIAAKNINIIADKVPYLFVPGNHDYNGDPSLRDRTNFNNFFNFAKFSNYSWYGGHYPSNGNENSYATFTSTAGDFLVMGLDLCPSDDALNWSDRIITENSDKKVIISTHAYLSDSGDRVISGKYNSCNNNGIIGNEGEDIWTKLVSKHQNIVLVVSGHKTGIAQKTDMINEYPVNQLLQNYQMSENGGNGYLRIFTFKTSNRTISVETYSPYLNQYNSSSINQFTLNYKD